MYDGKRVATAAVSGIDARLALASDDGFPSISKTERVAVFAPRRDMSLLELPKAQSDLITRIFPDFSHFERASWTCLEHPKDRYGAALVCLPRSKSLSYGLIAQACSVTDGPVLVDGAKTDGVEAVLKACKTRAQIDAVYSKAHGKLFVLHPPFSFGDWTNDKPSQNQNEFLTTPGVFSADGVDPASKLLGDILPGRLGGVVADLGAGWGYLAHRALENDAVEAVHLIEADNAALDCARFNIQDPRAAFHWQDAMRWSSKSPIDCVVMNPPFHTNRKAEPELGKSFIKAAYRLLRPKGLLVMVANRHLPYETEIKKLFADVNEIGGDNQFKLLQASRPSRVG